MSKQANSKSIVNQIITKSKAKKQYQTLRIIFNYVTRGRLFPNDVIDTIATYLFPNPITFLNPIFIPTKNVTFKEKRIMLFRSVNQQYLRKIKIINIWRCKQCKIDDSDIMKKGKYLLQFFKPLRITQEPQYDQFTHSYKQQQKFSWSSNKYEVSINSSNYSTTRIHLKQLKRYQMKKQMNYSIKKALVYLMNCDIVVIQYLNNQKKDIIFQNGQKQRNNNKNMECVEGQWRLKNCQEVWKRVGDIRKRGELQIIDQSGKYYNILDYHVLPE